MTQLSISHSSVKAWRRCKRQFYYKFVLGLESRRPSQPLKLGSWIHELMEAYYTTGGWEKKQAQLVKEWKKLGVDEREFYGDLPGAAADLMKAYNYHYREEHENWEILHCEERFVVEDDDGNKFSFKPDLIIQELDTGLIACVDHKSGKSLPDADWRIEDLQSTLYPWALEQVGISIDIFIFNYLKTTGLKVPSVNKNGQLSTRKVTFEYFTLANYLIDFYGSKSDIPKYWRIRLGQAKKDTSQFLKRSRIVKDPILVNRQIEELDWTSMEMLSFIEFVQDNPDSDPWVRSLDRSCNFACDFHDLCQADLLGADTSFMKKSQYRPSKYTEELIQVGNKPKAINPRKKSPKTRK
jgi:CRISPR/Cas system-associated exonuclease Cas4 (RecB family)